MRCFFYYFRRRSCSWLSFFSLDGAGGLHRHPPPPVPPSTDQQQASSEAAVNKVGNGLAVIIADSGRISCGLSPKRRRFISVDNNLKGDFPLIA